MTRYYIEFQRSLSQIRHICRRALKENESVKRSQQAREVGAAVADARRKLRGLQAEKARAKEKTEKVAEAREATEAAGMGRGEWTPAVGDVVFVPSIGSNAVVEKIVGNGAKRVLTLRKGMLTMSKIGVEQVEKAR